MKDCIPDMLLKCVKDIKLDKKYNTYFFDFDNTLMPWHSDNLSNDILNLILKLVNNNIKVIIASNGKGYRFENIKRQLPKEIDILQGLGKPKTKKLKRYILNNKINTEKAIFIGDNLITDIYTANKLGLSTIKVKPIAFREFWATKLYRILELFIYLIYINKFKSLKKQS